ncbi:cupin domain-containing protein [Oceanithermus sp.]
MKKKNLFDSPHHQVFPGVSASAFGGEKVMLMHAILERGATVPEHSHPEEQISFVLEGRLAFQIDGEVCEVAAGEAVHIPSGAAHAVRALEPSLVVDVFSPVRLDLIEKLGG